MRYSNFPILIVEDTKETQDLLVYLCQASGLTADVADNGKNALRKIDSGKKYSIYIVDLMMPEMDGKTFLHQLKLRQPDAVVLIQSALDSSETVIDIMKMGVFDYIVKPIDPDLFDKTVKKALEYKYLKDLEIAQSMGASKKIRNQMDWLIFKENRRVVDKDDTDIRSIYNLRATMTQGAGFGSLITMLDLMNAMKKDNNDGNYLIDKQLLDSILQNNEYLRNQLDGLKVITNILDNEIEMNKTNSVQLMQQIPQMVASIESYLPNKKLKVTYPEQTYSVPLNVNIEKISLCIEEIVINAYKYCLPKTTLNIFTKVSQGYFWISVKNDISEKDLLSQDDEKLVVEPFYRLMPYDESVAEIEKFGIGLGLTVVDNIARKHGGIFMIKSAKNYCGDEPKNIILSEMLLPIADE